MSNADAKWWNTAGPARRALLWSTIVLFVAIGYQSVIPPSPLPEDAPAEQFSADRAFGHVEAIARQPHPMGTAAIAEVRAYILEQLGALRVDSELQTTVARDYYGGPGSVDVINIIARIPGTEGASAVALMAHYDTVPATPGGNDNSVAVAALLETGRALLAGPPLRNDVLLLFTDGEEPNPRPGSNALVERHPAVADIGLIVNLEASGGSGAALLAETSGPEEWLLRELASVDAHPAAFSFLTETARLLGDIGTDFDAFRRRGISGFHFAYLRNSPIYHTAADDIAAVSRGSLQHHGNHALGIARHFGNLDLTDPPDGDAVFFAVRPVFVAYPTAWALPLAILVVAFSATALAIHRQSLEMTKVLRNLARTVGIGLFVTVGATLAWLGISAVRTTPGVVESYLYLIAMLATTIYVARALVGRSAVRGAAIVVIWVILALITALAAPGFSYLFTWPALAAAMAIAWRKPTTRPSSLAGFALVAGMTLVILTPAIDTFFLFAQPRPGNPDSQLAAAIAVPVLLGLLGAGLISAVWPNAGDGHRGAARGASD